MTFHRTVFGAALAGTMATAAGAGPAIEIPSCGLGNFVSAELYAKNQSVIMFVESDDGVYPFWVAMADCKTRNAVAFKDRGRTVDVAAKEAADKMLLDALKGKTLVSAKDMRNRLRKLGLRAKSYKLADDHCSCDLNFDDNPSLNAALYD